MRVSVRRMYRLDTWHCHSSTELKPREWSLVFGAGRKGRGVGRKVPVRGKGVWGDGKSGCRTQGQRRGLGPINLL